MYLFLGTGTTDYEQKLMDLTRRCVKFVFLNLYSEAISDALYTNGTIFMMPSSYEPCGIGQMVAMRDGQPCVVHAVGGLKDTVEDGVNGFTFSGSNISEQVQQYVATTRRAVETYLKNKPIWEKICANALQARFTWEKSAMQYAEFLYF